MTDYGIWFFAAALIIWALVTVVDIKYERSKIDRYLRVGGARILEFRWKPFLAWMGADWKSKHYEVTFEEHSGRVIRAMFTYTADMAPELSSGHDKVMSCQAGHPGSDERWHQSQTDSPG